MRRLLTSSAAAGLLSMALCAAAQAADQPPAAGNTDEVAKLKAQVVELQNKIVGLEQKLAAQAASASSSVVSRTPAAPQTVSYIMDDDPFAMMEAMDRQMQAMMSASGMGLTPMVKGHGRQGVFNPDYDMKETDKAYVLSFDMPGMDKPKISVEIKDGSLLVSGERSTESKEGQGDKYYRQQRSFGYFSRVIPMPKDIDDNSVQAKYDNGVLTVTVAKKEPPKKQPAQKVEIK